MYLLITINICVFVWPEKSHRFVYIYSKYCNFTFSYPNNNNELLWTKKVSILESIDMIDMICVASINGDRWSLCDFSDAAPRLLQENQRYISQLTSLMQEAADEQTKSIVVSVAMKAWRCFPLTPCDVSVLPLSRTKTGAGRNTKRYRLNWKRGTREQRRVPRPPCAPTNTKDCKPSAQSGHRLAWRQEWSKNSFFFSSQTKTLRLCHGGMRRNLHDPLKNQRFSFYCEAVAPDLGASCSTSHTKGYWPDMWDTS